MGLLDRLIDKETGNMRAMLRLSKATHALNQGDRDSALSELALAERDADVNDDSLASELRHVQAWARG